MSNWKGIMVKPNYTLLETMRIIDKAAKQFAVVIDDNNYLCGTVTDGDIRRGILRGKGLNVEISTIMNSSPIFASEGETVDFYQNLMKTNQLKQLPILDEEKKVVNILFLDSLTSIKHKKNKVILMLGGLGTRLKPLTNEIPKPMLPVGEKPIVETIIDGFKKYGYTDFIFCVNYKKEIIQNYFGNGKNFGIKIEYIEENKRMGTAGALSLLKKWPDEPFFVMNGDLLTKINYEQLMEYHINQKAIGTMCVREYEYQIPYGVIEVKENKIKSIKEKPIHRSFINAGVYVLNPDVKDYIPNEKFYDMPTLFEHMNEQQNEASVFPIHEYWLDIGHLDEYHRANKEIKEQSIW